MKKPLTRVTDHAVLRYLERVHGIDIETLRRSIGKRCDEAARVGARAIQIDGYSFQFAIGADGHPVVTTVLPRGASPLYSGPAVSSE